jgi:hypothetical protein
MADPTNAPVCEIIPQIVTTQPPQSKLPFIPIATDLASALAAINAMRQWMMQMQQIQPGRTIYGGFRGNNNQGHGGGTAKNPTPKPPQQGRWQQKDITRQTVRVYNPKDKEQFVDVSRVTRLVMQDTVTGEQWIWSG